MDIHRIVVTGVNRGLGKDLLRLILTQDPGFQVIGTVRSKVQQLQSSLQTEFPNNSLKIMELDISNKQSIGKFAAKLRDNNITFDCLINNAAVGADYGEKLPDPQIAESYLTTNFIGTVDLTHQLLPLLRPNGRVINVSSKLGGLCYHDAQVREWYTKDDLSLQWMKKQVQYYIEACKKGSLDHYFKSAYGTSKMMLNAWSRFILKKLLKPGQLVISMSPGHCKTDMAGGNPIRTSQDGAQSIYQHIRGDRSSQVFYHVNSQSDFVTCG